LYLAPDTPPYLISYVSRLFYREANSDYQRLIFTGNFDRR